MIDFFVFLFKTMWDFIVLFIGLTFMEKYYFKTKFERRKKLLVVISLVLLWMVIDQLRGFIGEVI